MSKRGGEVVPCLCLSFFLSSAGWGRRVNTDAELQTEGQPFYQLWQPWLLYESNKQCKQVCRFNKVPELESKGERDIETQIRGEEISGWEPLPVSIKLIFIHGTSWIGIIAVTRSSQSQLTSGKMTKHHGYIRVNSLLLLFNVGVKVYRE